MPADQVHIMPTTFFGLFTSPRASPREHRFLSSRELILLSSRHSSLTTPSFAKNVQNLSSRFLIGVGKDCKVWVKDAVLSLKFVKSIHLVGNTWQHYTIR